MITVIDIAKWKAALLNLHLYLFTRASDSDVLTFHRVTRLLLYIKGLESIR